MQVHFAWISKLADKRVGKSGLIIASAAWLLASCAEGSKTPAPLEIGRSGSAVQSEASSGSTSSGPTSSGEANVEEDVISSLIAQLGTDNPSVADNAASSVISETPEIIVPEPELTPELPTTTKTSLAAGSTTAQQEAEQLSPEALLGQEALDAAFGLLASRVVQNTPEDQLVAPRIEGEFRIGMMLPFSGPYAALGADIASGVELALFQLKLPDLSLIYLDTGAGEKAQDAAQIAKAADLDIIIGPLFSKSIDALSPTLAELAIPALTLTNNQDMARPNSWMFGYIPEQQIDLLIAQAIEAGDKNFAILASQDTFAQRLTQHSLQRLEEFGITPAEVMILAPELQADETELRRAIQRFARYQPAAESIPPSAYDSLILVGLPSFLLRVAPVLDYYDMGPDRVRYLGTDLWNRPELLSEPSLQDGYVAVAEQPDDTAFRDVWQENFEQDPSVFGKLGFDVLAVIGALHSQVSDSADWSKILTREQGYSGFSGNFALLPDGTNQRSFVIKQIIDNTLQDIDQDAW